MIPRRLLAWALVLAACVAAAARAEDPSCRAPVPVCAARHAVFAVSAYDPLASATRIGPDLLVTNRHVVADRTAVELRLGDGRRIAAEVVPAAYRGDLVLLRAAETLGPGPVLRPAPGPPEPGESLYALGVAPGDARVRAYAPGRLLRAPAAGRPLARLHHDAASGPGQSGGALVDGAGRLVGIVAAGGDGRNEAIPAAALATILAATGPAHGARMRALGAAIRRCDAALGRAARLAPRLDEPLAAALETDCPASGNRQLVDLAAQALGRAGRHARAIALFERALAEDPNAINARIGLAVTLHLARRFAAAVPHLERLLEALPEDPRLLRMATQAGKWGGAPRLAERALALIEAHHPQMAPAARRFLEAATPPPAPPR